jgi:hypothetical protein
MLDGMHVGVAAAEKDVVEDGLSGSGAFDGVVDVMNLGFWVSKVASAEGWEGSARGAAEMLQGIDLHLASVDLGLGRQGPP